MAAERISHFEILDELGSGAMGVVYRARDEVLGREVALKKITPRLVSDPRARTRFLRECRLAASLNHPGIATVYEAGETEDGDLFFACELVEGETLKDLLSRGALSPEESLRLGVQLADAIGAAHEAGVVHRDIKPGNLMVQPDGRLKVLDFGLAFLDRGDEVDTEEATRTGPGMLVGTPAYMSPEQVTGDRVDARSDVFSAGGVLYEMATGKRPFSGRSSRTTLEKVLSQEPDDPKIHRGDLPAELRTVILRALSKDPGKRYASGLELAGALREAGGGTFTSSDSLYRGSGTRNRSGVWAAAGLVALLALGGFAAWRTLAPASLAFEERDLLVLADVDNRTDEEVFGEALRAALEADLQQSRFASVLDRGRAVQTLQLLRKDPGTPIDESTGRDICRFAGARALLLPRILAAGDAFELQAVLIDPVTGQRRETVRVSARGREQVLLEGIDQLSRKVRERLGESLTEIEQADAPVVQAATGSWEALQYFARAINKRNAGEIDQTISLLELALEKDPSFPSAKGFLGMTLIEFTREGERGRQLLNEAFLDSEDLPEKERLMLRAAHLQFVENDPEEALREYDVITGIYPDMMQAYNNSGRILMALGRFEEAATMFEQAAEQDRGIDSVPLYNLWFVCVNRLRQPERAEQAARRMAEQAPENGNQVAPLGWSLVTLGRWDEADSVLRRALERMPHHAYALPNLAHVQLGSGHPAAAARTYEQIVTLADQGVLASEGTRNRLDWATALAAAGDPRLQDVLVETDGKLDEAALRAGWSEQQVMLMRAEIAALRGESAEARRLLDRAQQNPTANPYGLLNLARVQARLGLTEETLATLEQMYEAGYPDPYFPLVMPSFRDLRNDPRFLQMFGLTEIQYAQESRDGISTTG